MSREQRAELEAVQAPMDRAQRDRFERLQSSASRLAAELVALDAQVLAATTAADEVGRGAEAHRQALDSTMSADDELRPPR